MKHVAYPGRSGFTLIELLVVIAVIAIMAAILFPVFAQARDKARQAACASNMKQIGQAYTMYQQDYDETFPPYTSSPGGDITGMRAFGWYDLLDSYTKNEKMFLCPSGHYRTTTGVRIRMPRAEGFWGIFIVASYAAPSPGFNWQPFVRRTVWDYWGTNPVKLAEVNKPADTVSLMEAAIHPWINDWYRYGFERNGVPMPVDPSTKRWGENIVLRHNETMNVVYADGHVKAAKPFSTPEVYNVDQR